jgi:hypothetical protein
MLPFLRRSYEIKTRTQSSEHGVVATGQHGHLLSGCFVEGHVGLLGGPDAMEKDGQLTGYRNDSLALACLPPRAARCRLTVAALSSFHEVGGYGWHTRSADFGGRRCQPW